LHDWLVEGADLLLAWYDATPRAEVLQTLLGEVEREMMIRMVRQAAGAAGGSAECGRVRGIAGGCESGAQSHRH
jgi:hypothetical protein